jgi:glutaredoxin-like protein
MTLISDSDRETIRKHFEENLTGDVDIVMFTERESPIIIPGRQTCQTCKETQRLLEELTALSDKLRLTVHDVSTATEQAASYGIDRVPAFVIEGANRGRVRFFGIPAGYEFSALVADLVDASAGSTSLSEESRAFLGSLDQEVHIQVFTTPG